MKFLKMSQDQVKILTKGKHYKGDKVYKPKAKGHNKDKSAALKGWDPKIFRKKKKRS